MNPLLVYRFVGVTFTPKKKKTSSLLAVIRNARFVDDEYRAKLLSLKGGGKMKAVYVDTKRQLDMVRKAKAGGFCKEVGAVRPSRVGRFCFVDTV